jgi:hypothetical protein
MLWTMRPRTAPLTDRKPAPKGGRLRKAPPRRVDPVLAALALAPMDDEPVTPEEAEALGVARADSAAGRVVSHDDLRRELGLP